MSSFLYSSYIIHPLLISLPVITLVSPAPPPSLSCIFNPLPLSPSLPLRLSVAAKIIKTSIGTKLVRFLEANDIISDNELSFTNNAHA